MLNAGVKQAFVALGSNLGESVALLDAAFAHLEQLSVVPARRSSIYRSVPVDCPPGSPDFLNAVAAIVPLPGETPETLLRELQQLERKFGRRPKVILNEPRSLDLDLIAFGAEVRATAKLVLPHPRAHLRGFVLAPLVELAPDFVLPGQSQAVCELLAGLPPDQMPSVLG
jgi:2-amino-4-hydroxy-6-hydroxymethyldihydropteridine diphosphokinase